MRSILIIPSIWTKQVFLYGFINYNRSLKMACIQERPNENGDVSYRVSIRKKGHIISKSFYTKEDAEIYAFYKERLIDLMENFEVPIEKRLTLQSIMNIRPQENTWGH